MKFIFATLFTLLMANSLVFAIHDSEDLINLLNFSILSKSKQILINIPTSFSPWRSLDVIQYNNKLNLQWESKSLFQNCKDLNNNCINSSNFIDIGDKSDAAATYELKNPIDYQFTYINYLSPILTESLDNDYNVSFLVIVEYDDFTQNKYAVIDTLFS